MQTTREHNYLTRQSDETQLDKDVYWFIKRPLIILFGMIVVGAVLDSMLKTSNVFTIIFTLAGGFGAVGDYFKEGWKAKQPTNPITESKPTRTEKRKSSRAKKGLNPSQKP